MNSLRLERLGSSPPGFSPQQATKTTTACCPHFKQNAKIIRKAFVKLGKFLVPVCNIKNKKITKNIKMVSR